MNVLNTITKLRHERKWSEYQLSVQSQLPQSTISSWYRKNMLPSLASLEKICNAFDITMAEFFIIESGKNTSQYLDLLDAEQQQLLQCWRKLNKKQKELLLEFLKTL